MGNMLAGVTSAYMCSIPIDNGWPFIFYVQGTGYNAVVVIPDVGVVDSRRAAVPVRFCWG